MENYSLDQILRRIQWLVVLAVIYGLVAGFLLPSQVSNLVKFGVIAGFLVLMSFFAWRWLVFSQKHTQGIRGEIKVGAMLAQLPTKDFWSQNDIDLPGLRGNIDHIVVGKTGVWLIETKHWTGDNIAVKDGILKKDSFVLDSKYLRSVKSRALTLKTYLAECGATVGWVQSVLVFSTDAMSVQVPERFEHVHVVGFRELPALITGGAENQPLTSEQRRRIQSAIEKRPNC